MTNSQIGDTGAKVNSRASDTSARSVAIVAALSAVLAATTFAVVRETLIDDTFITLDYARNLAFHFEWGLISRGSSNSATSPLNVFVLAAVLRVVRDPTWTIGVVFVGSYATFGWALARSSRALNIPVAASLLIVLVTLLNPLLLSVVGMEITTLGLVVIALMMISALEARPLLFAVAAALALLTRLDFAIVVLTFLLAVPALRHRWRVISLLTLTLIAPWFTFSWIHLGSAIPDTLAIKSSQAWSDSFLTGWSFYGSREPATVVIAFLSALGGLGLTVVALFPRRLGHVVRDVRSRPVFALGGAGIAYFVAYALLAPPPYLWYYGPVIIPLTMSGILLAFLTFSANPDRTWRRRPVRIAAFAVLVILVAEVGALGANQARSWIRPPIVGNLASAEDYARIGRALRLRLRNSPVAIRAEIGALAYYCSCELLDVFSDRGIVIPLIEDSIAARGTVGAAVLRANYEWLHRYQLPRVPQYYLDFVAPSRVTRDRWPTRALLSGDRVDLALFRSPATPAIVHPLVDGVVAQWRHRRRVVLHSDTGGDADIKVDLYLYAVAADLRARGEAVELHHDGGSGRSLTVATGSGVDVALLHRSRHPQVRAYHGRVSLSERVRLARLARTITRRHETGHMRNLDFLVRITEIRRQTANDVLVYGSNG